MASPSFENSMPNRSTAYPFSQAGQLAKPLLHPSDTHYPGGASESCRELADQVRLLQARLGEDRAEDHQETRERTSPLRMGHGESS